MIQGPELPRDPSVREQLSGLAHYLRKTLRFWPHVLATLVLGAAAFAVFLRFHQPKYRSETVILYVQKGDTEQEVESSETQRSVTVRLREMLYARPNLERVVRQFNLYPRLRETYGIVDAVEELKKHVDFRAPGGDTFSIGFEGISAEQARAVTAELARLVIDGDAELRKDQAKVALDFLVGERQTRDAELKAAEQNLAAFMAQHPRFALDATPLANGAAIRATFGTAPPGGAPVRSFAPARPAAAAGSPASSPPISQTNPPGKPADPEEARARAALAAARETLTERLVHYTPAHPDVRAAEAEVQRATERLAAITGAASANASATKPGGAGEAAATPAPTPAAAPAAPHPVSAAPAAVRNSGVPAPAARTDTLVELETEWLKLTRAVTEARQRLDQIESQLFRADIQVNSEAGGHGVQVSVIDPAFLPQTPLPPGKLTLALIFFAGALVLGVLGAMAFAVFDERVFTERELGRVAEVLVRVPKSSMRRAHVAS